MVALIVALLEHPERAAEIRGCLESADHVVYVVNSFPRAKAILQERKFDLIISDVHLENGGSVFDFLKWVKSDHRMSAVPFVLISLEPTEMAKYLADGVRAAARYMGAAKYISMEKFDAVTLLKEIGELLPAVTTVPVLTKEGD
jgi:CheY-like chemotaxis protein